MKLVYVQQLNEGFVVYRPVSAYMNTSTDENQTHQIQDFTNQIQYLPEGKYKTVDGEIVPF